MASGDHEKGQGQTGDPIRLEPNISKRAGHAILQQSLITIDICCEAVRSVILTTAWLLVSHVTF